MKRLLAPLLLLVLAACTLVGPVGSTDPNLIATREGTVVTYQAKIGPVLLIGASARIPRFESDVANACKYIVTSAGPDHALQCKAPVVVKMLDFAGQARGQVVSVDGLKAYTATVQAP